jgi:hypothetical protein
MEVRPILVDLIRQGNQPGLHDRAFLMEAFEWPEKE